MSELYKAIAGSPITYLSSDISAAQTTISIADDSALPDAPNICTIGYGENIETIRYGAKSNGVLQNVTRGIEGTPRAWSAGTEVARFFTAYDHNAIIAELDARLILENGNAEIDGNLISSGNITISGYTAVDRRRGRTAANRFYIGDGNCRVDTSNGAIRLYTTAIGASSDSGIRVDANGSLNVVASGVTRHHFGNNGTKSGGTIEIEGTTYGMSPIDSPQVLIEDIMFDVYVDGRTEIQLDNIFAKSISQYAVFSSCGQVQIVEKGEDYFIVDGYTGTVDFRIVGKRVNEEHRYFEIMGGFEHGVAEEIVE